MRDKKQITDSGKKALLVYSLLKNEKAKKPVILDLRQLTLITDFFVICHGTSPTQIKGLAASLQEEMEKNGIRNQGFEGYQESDWVLMDYGDVVVHIFSEEQREFYALEKLWGDAPRSTQENMTPELLTKAVKPGGEDD